MNKNLLNVIKILMITIFIISLVLANVISHDSHDMEHCEDEHCLICIIIHAAQTIVNVSFAIVICEFIAFLIYFVLSRLHKNERIFVQESLVFQKVQMNE